MKKIGQADGMGISLKNFILNSVKYHISRTCALYNVFYCYVCEKKSHCKREKTPNRVLESKYVPKRKKFICVWKMDVKIWENCQQQQIHIILKQWQHV